MTVPPPPQGQETPHHTAQLRPLHAPRLALPELPPVWTKAARALLEKRLPANGAPTPQSQAQAAQLLEWANGEDVGAAQLLEWLLVGAPDHDPTAETTGNALYCEDTKRWWLWNGTRWLGPERIAWGELATLCMDAYSRAKRHLGGLDDSELKAAHKTLEKGRKRMATARHLAAACTMLSEGRFAKPTDFDRVSPKDTLHRLQTPQHATLELGAGTHAAKAPSRGDRITKLLGANYDPGAKAPTWAKFVATITKDEAGQDDPALAAYLGELMGLSLTGHMPQNWWLFYGTGANGKSTYVNTWLKLLGDYAAKAPPEAVLTSYNGNPSDRYAGQWVGARLLAVPEVPVGRELNAELLKTLAGGDVLHCNPKYREPFSYTPVAKLVMVANDKPKSRDTTHGMWRKAQYVPFRYTVPPSEQDPQLEHKLADELAGILNWALEGWARFVANGYKFTACPAVEGLTKEVREEADTVAVWASERLEIVDPAQLAATDEPPTPLPLKAMFADWQAWVKDTGNTFPHGTKRAQDLRPRLEALGCLIGKHGRNRAAHGLNVRLLSD